MEAEAEPEDLAAELPPAVVVLNILISIEHDNDRIELDSRSTSGGRRTVSRTGDRRGTDDSPTLRHSGVGAAGARASSYGLHIGEGGRTGAVLEDGRAGFICKPPFHISFNLHSQGDALGKVNGPGVGGAVKLAEVLDLHSKSAIAITDDRINTDRSRAGVLAVGEGQIVRRRTTSPAEEHRLWESRVNS